MDSLMESDEWKQGAGDALKFLTDPESMEALQKQVRTIYTCMHRLMISYPLVHFTLDFSAYCMFWYGKFVLLVL